MRKLGADTVHSFAQMLKLTSLKENDKAYVSPRDMLRELMIDNKTVIKNLRAAHEVCDEHGDIATASIIENLIDEAERRNCSCSRPAAASRTGIKRAVIRTNAIAFDPGPSRKRHNGSRLCAMPTHRSAGMTLVAMTGFAASFRPS